MTVKEYSDRIIQNVNKVIIGKDEVIRQILVCFLAKGHVLLEDLPGTGKTMLVRAFSKIVVREPSLFMSCFRYPVPPGTES